MTKRLMYKGMQCYGIVFFAFRSAKLLRFKFSLHTFKPTLPTAQRQCRHAGHLFLMYPSAEVWLQVTPYTVSGWRQHSYLAKRTVVLNGGLLLFETLRTTTLGRQCRRAVVALNRAAGFCIANINSQTFECWMLHSEINSGKTYVYIIKSNLPLQPNPVAACNTRMRQPRN